MIPHPTPQRRTAIVQRVPVISRETLKQQLLANSDVEAGFAHICAPISPRNATTFVVASDGHQLIIAVQIHESKIAGLPYALITPPPYKGGIEILFNLRDDSQGFCHYFFEDGKFAGVDDFSPYPEAHSSKWKLPEVIECSFEPQQEANQRGYWVHHLFVTFRNSEIFEFGESIGFNVCRNDLQTEEFSAWNFLAGNGAQDASSLGRLSFNSAAVDPGQIGFEPAEKFLVSIVNDVPDTVLACRYTPKGLDNEMRKMREWGIGRVDWIDYSNSPAFWEYERWKAPYSETVEACGDFLGTAIKAAHRNGLEFISNIKLFDLTLQGFSCSESAPGAIQHWDGAWIASVPDIAGKDDAYMQSNPEWRKNFAFPVKRIRLYSRTPVPQITSADLKLSVSSDNREYKPVETCSVRVEKCRRQHQRWEVDGLREEAGVRENWVIEISDLDIHTTFFHIECLKPGVVLKNRLFLFAEAFDQEGHSVPVEVSQRLNPDGGTRMDFHTGWRGWNNHNPGILSENSWALSSIGLAFVDPQNLQGMLEPTHPKSRQIWLDRIQTLLDAGVDGVGIRPLCHHNYTSSWARYAFAPTVIAAFKEQFGRAPEATDSDLEKINLIRGEAITELLRAARGLCDSKNAKLIFHVESGTELPAKVGNRMQMYFDFEKWMREKLLDELHIRSISAHWPWLRNYLLPLAKKHGVKIHLISRNLHSGMESQGVTIYRRIVEDAIRAGLDGFAFYETAGLYEMNEQDAVVPKGLSEPVILAATDAAAQCR